MPVRISDAVVVITGASSGIGKATALEFAKRGARLVLAARRIAALERTRDECARLGAPAHAVPADVTEESDVGELVRRVLDRYERIDVWVNDAAVYTAGPFAETPSEVFRRVIETDFFGYVNGARAVLPIFKRQGRGVLVNVGSMVSKLSEPYFSADVAAKHAVHGFSKCLRQELALEGARDVHVCTVMPATVDTPFFQHAANYSGRALKAMPPVYRPEKVAKAIADCAEHPKREVFVGNAARLFNLQYRLSAAWTETLLAKLAARGQFYPDRPVNATEGNLFAPLAQGDSVDGNWRGAGGFHPEDLEARRRSVRQRKAAVAAGAFALAAGALWLRGRYA
jgi:short-subunit dehydrogenase